MFVTLVDAVAVPRPGGRGRHRKRLDHLTADEAYGSKANRRWPIAGNLIRRFHGPHHSGASGHGDLVCFAQRIALLT